MHGISVHRFSSSLEQNGNQEGHSTQSLSSAMGRFVKAVDNMDETIMIPSRLMDMSVSGSVTDQNMNDSKALLVKKNVKNGSRNQEDLYNFYTMLNAVKTELTISPADVTWVTDEEIEGKEAGTHQSDIAGNAAALFRHHLKGLFTVLDTMTDTADFLTMRYQEDVGELPCIRGSTPPSQSVQYL